MNVDSEADLAYPSDGEEQPTQPLGSPLRHVPVVNNGNDIPPGLSLIVDINDDSTELHSRDGGVEL